MTQVVTMMTIRMNELDDEQLAATAYVWHRRVLAGEKDALRTCAQLEQELQRRLGPPPSNHAPLQTDQTNRRPRWRLRWEEKVKAFKWMELNGNILLDNGVFDELLKKVLNFIWWFVDEVEQHMQCVSSRWAALLIYTNLVRLPKSWHLLLKVAHLALCQRLYGQT